MADSSSPHRAPIPLRLPQNAPASKVPFSGVQTGGRLGASELSPWTSERKAHCSNVLAPVKKTSQGKKKKFRGLKKQRGWRGKLELKELGWKE